MYGKKKSKKLSTNIRYAKPWHILPVSQPQTWEKEYEDRGHFQETPAAFYARKLKAGLETQLALHSKLVTQFGMDAVTPEHDNLERVDKLIAILRQRLRDGLKFHEQLSREQSSNGIEEPPGWTGPKRYKKRD